MRTPGEPGLPGRPESSTGTKTTLPGIGNSSMGRPAVTADQKSIQIGRAACPPVSPLPSESFFSSNHTIGHQIYVVDVATGEQRRLSSIGHGGCEPRFSRDGKKVVYVSRGHMRPTSRLVAYDLATGGETTLVDWPALNYDPVYSPDGSELAFASNVTGSYAIYRQRLSDGKAWRVTFAPGEARYPDYRPVASR